MAIAWPGSARFHRQWWTGRVGLLAIAVVCAYWLSLASLWRDLGGQSPLAFVGLAPVLAFGLLLAGLARRQPMPAPGRIDLTVGIALIAGAGAIILVGPFLASVYFWTARLDLLSLPLFVGGALILLFGWRVLFVARGALMLLLLSWPLPYIVLIENTGDLLTKVTVAALAAVTSVFPIATQTSSTSGIFTVAFAEKPFQVQVATACAGLNSTVAFLMVGAAFTMLVNGRLPAKLLWLALGLLVVFCLNVLRVVLLVAVGATWGPSAALDLFHPVAGMLSLLVGLIVMLALLPRFGLHLPPLRATGSLTSPMPHRSPTPTRRSMAARTALLLTAAAAFGTANGTFAAYERLPELGAAAQPLIVRAPAEERPQIGDRIVTSQKEYTIGKPYYGEDSTWVRYRLSRGRDAPIANRYQMWLDDIRAPDREKLAAFGVEKCYGFHGHSIDASEPVALGGGVVGRIVVTTFATSRVPWVVLWWEWPIETRTGIVHERLVLLARATAQPEPEQVEVDGKPIVMFDFSTAVPREYRALATDMTAFGRQIVLMQTGGRLT